MATNHSRVPAIRAPPFQQRMLALTPQPARAKGLKPNQQNIAGEA